MTRWFAKKETAASNSAPEIQDLVQAAIRRASEQGWFGDNGQDVLFRTWTQGELILREQRLHGEIGPTVEQLTEELRALLLHRVALDERHCDPLPLSPPAWHWDWRRASGGVLLVLPAGIMLSPFAPVRASLVFPGLAAVATLWSLGPWALGQRWRQWVSVLAAEARSLRRRRKQGTQQRRLERRVRTLEERMGQARTRCAKHARWVEQRLAVVMAHYDLQRRRAEQARKIATAANV